jgi:hypothetical protein
MYIDYTYKARRGWNIVIFHRQDLEHLESSLHLQSISQAQILFRTCKRKNSTISIKIRKARLDMLFILRGEDFSAAYVFTDVTHRLIARVFLFSGLNDVRVNAEDNANHGQNPHQTV